jgi:hypothetical protein
MSFVLEKKNIEINPKNLQHKASRKIATINKSSFSMEHLPKLLKAT